MVEKRLPTVSAWDIIDVDEDTGKKRVRKVYATSKAEVLKYMFASAKKSGVTIEPLSPLAKRVKAKFDRDNQ